MVLLVLAAGWWFRARPADGDLPALSILLLAAAAAGSVMQTLLRLEIGARLGGHRARNLESGHAETRHLEPAHVVLTPIGYRDGARSGAGVTGSDEGLRVIAGPALALWGVALVLLIALEGVPAAGWISGGAPELVGRWELGAVARVAAWVWLVQGTAMLLPIPGSAGRQILWRIVARCCRRVAEPAESSGAPFHSTIGSPPVGDAAVRVGRRVDQIQGTMAVLLAGVALWLWQREPVDLVVPMWPFLLALAILIWAGRGAHALRPMAAPAAGSVIPGGASRPRAAARGLSWWKRLRIRRAQRAERGEAADARRLDEVLARLHASGFDSLSSADRMLLRRVSQRLRQTRGESR